MIFIGLLLLFTALACGIGTVAPTDLPLMATNLPTVEPTAVPPTETPLPSPTPEPSLTPLPGVEVIPMDKFSSTIPWLPMDNTARPGVDYVGFNVKRAPFDNPLVRQAFTAAIDRQVLLDIVLRLGSNKPVPATNFTPPETLGRNIFGEVGIPYDPQKAKELFIKAGYSDPNSFPEVMFLTNSAGGGAPGVHQQLAEAMVKMWKENLGVKVNFKVLNRELSLIKLQTIRRSYTGWGGWLIIMTRIIS